MTEREATEMALVFAAIADRTQRPDEPKTAPYPLHAGPHPDTDWVVIIHRRDGRIVAVEDDCVGLYQDMAAFEGGPTFRITLKFIAWA